MPIYEYRCSACRHELEAIQKFSDAPLIACPQCGKDTLVKLVSAAGFQLKGSGWYQTDFRGSGSKPAAKADAAAGDKPADGAKIESAPAATAEAAPAKSDAGASTPSPSSTPPASA
jgi:putative FmdB family regulatory protein